MAVPTNKLLERVLDYAALKQKVISQNIANAGTINYKRKDVEFSATYSNAIKSVEKNHIGSIGGNQKTLQTKIKVVTDDSENLDSGFNNVDVNKEMADMAQNTILFKFAARKLNNYFKSLQYVISGGKR